MDKEQIDLIQHIVDTAIDGDIPYDVAYRLIHTMNVLDKTKDKSRPLLKYPYNDDV